MIFYVFFEDIISFRYLSWDFKNADLLGLKEKGKL